MVVDGNPKRQKAPKIQRHHNWPPGTLELSSPSVQQQSTVPLLSLKKVLKPYPTQGAIFDTH